jgi:hypothetical protein
MKETMKALVIRGEWAPKPDYRPNEWEIRERIALRANKVFKNPTWAVEKHEVKESLKFGASGICA